VLFPETNRLFGDICIQALHHVFEPCGLLHKYDREFRKIQKKRPCIRRKDLIKSGTV
jgi:hypothetical protein